MDWIERKVQRSFELNLIYRDSRDGFTKPAFHSKCDNKSPTISYIKSDKNRIFGGYTEQTWEGNNLYKSDDKAFLFSFTNNEKYPIKIPQHYTITHGGGIDIGISDTVCYLN